MAIFLAFSCDSFSCDCVHHFGSFLVSLRSLQRHSTPNEADEEHLQGMGFPRLTRVLHAYELHAWAAVVIVANPLGKFSSLEL